MEMRSPLARIRGLGSSNHGIQHWWLLRITGVALVPLTLWFVFFAVQLASADLATVKAWVGAHYNPALLILLIVCMFYHGQAGLQEVIEDYIHTESTKVASIVIVKFAAALLGACSAFAVLRLTFGG